MRDYIVEHKFTFSGYGGNVSPLCNFRRIGAAEADSVSGANAIGDPVSAGSDDSVVKPWVALDCSDSVKVVSHPKRANRMGRRGRIGQSDGAAKRENPSRAVEFVFDNTTCRGRSRSLRNKHPVDRVRPSHRPRIANLNLDSLLHRPCDGDRKRPNETLLGAWAGALNDQRPKPQLRRVIRFSAILVRRQSPKIQVFGNNGHSNYS